MGKSDPLSHRVDQGGDNGNITLLHPEFFAALQSTPLLLEGEECDILQEVQSRNCTDKLEDVIAKAGEELQRSKGKSI